MLKQRAPTADDYPTLEPGEVVWATLDLADGYAIHDAGSYLVSFDGNLAILGGTRAKVYGVDSMPGASAETTLVLSQDRPTPLSPMAKETTFTGCTVSNVLDQKNITFDCSCDEPFIYAYIYLHRPYEIYLRSGRLRS